MRIRMSLPALNRPVSPAVPALRQIWFRSMCDEGLKCQEDVCTIRLKNRCGTQSASWMLSIDSGRVVLARIDMFLDFALG